MKGFIKIMEAVIACVIIIATMTFFFRPPIISDWDSTLLQIQSKDALASLYQNGDITNYIFENDISGFNTILSEILPKTADFSIEVFGIPNPTIYIGTFNNANKNKLEETLKNNKTFEYRKRDIQLRIETIEPDEIEDYQKEGKLNILFLRPDEIKNNENKLRKFLKNFGTIFADREPDWSDDFFSEIFSRNHDNNHDKDYLDRIRKYYNAIGGSGSLPDIYPKEDVLVNGRSIYYLEWSDAAEKNLKAVLMWASAERYKMDTTAKTAPEKFVVAHHIAVGQNAEVYEVTLKTWHIFY